MSADDAIARGCDLFDEARRLLDEGRFDEAAAPCSAALALFEDAVGPDSLDVANVLETLAAIHEGLGRFASAEALLARAQGIVETAGPSSDDDVVRLEVNVLVGAGRIQRILGRHAAAATWLERGVALAERHFGPRSTELAGALNDLGVLCKYDHRFDEAAAAYRRALDIHLENQGPASDAVATLYHNLGGLEHERGRFAEGEPWARRAVEVREALLGPDHPHVAADLAALAGTLDRLGRADESEALYRRVIAVFEGAYGVDHVELAVPSNNLALILRDRGDLEEARALIDRSLAIKRAAFGEIHPDVARGLQNLGSVLRAQGRLAEAEAAFREAAHMLEATLGEHTRLARCLEALADLIADSRPDEAAALRRRASAIRAAREG